jgi:hypothetical protein
MKNSVTLMLGALVTVGTLIFGTSTASLAQTGTINPLEDFRTKDGGTDLFSGRSGQPTSVFDLIHRSVNAPSRSIEEFDAEKRENLDSAAEAFRAQQRARLKQQQATPAPSAAESANPASPNTTPASITN